MNILIGGDFVPTNSNKALFTKEDMKKLVGEELYQRYKNADFAIHNLEVPLTDSFAPIEKCGPCLEASPLCVSGLKELNPFFYTLANNHILDQDVEGLNSTIKVLQDAGISFGGVGTDSEDASKPFYIELCGVRIGIYCCCEHEFSIASEFSPGANLFDPLYSLDQIHDVKEHCDYLIVLHHGGKEHYRYPSPQLQRVCRRMVDKGADLVVCQHSHCIGCKEDWKNGTIVYGQGNFVFDLANNDCWNTGLIIQLEFKKDNKDPEIEYIPLAKRGERIVEAVGDEAEQILNGFLERSNQINEEGFVVNNYKKFAEQMRWEYYIAFSGKKAKNIIYRVINKLSGYRFVKYYIGKAYSKREKLVLKNFIECEAHRELLLEGLDEE